MVSNNQIDPTVLIDDDGQAYLYWGNPDLWYVKLNSDMISYSGVP
jgi:beta-xylosidase